MDTYVRINHLYIIQLRIWYIFHLIDSIDKEQKKRIIQCGHVWQENTSIYSTLYAFGLSLVSLEVLTRDEKITIQRGHVWRDKSYIYYIVKYLAYILFHWQS